MEKVIGLKESGEPCICASFFVIPLIIPTCDLLGLNYLLHFCYFQHLCNRLHPCRTVPLPRRGHCPTQALSYESRHRHLHRLLLHLQHLDLTRIRSPAVLSTASRTKTDVRLTRFAESSLARDTGGGDDSGRSAKIWGANVGQRVLLR